jgi:putative flippase GtrA
MKELTKYVYIGFISNLLNLVLYVYLARFNIELFICAFFGYVLGTLSSYIGNKYFTFNSNKPVSLFEIFMFCLVYCLGGITMIATIHALSNIANYIIIWFCGAFLAIVINFIGMKYHVFK